MDDEDEWTSYSSAGPSGESYNPWAELENTDQSDEESQNFDPIYSESFKAN